MEKYTAAVTMKEGLSVTTLRDVENDAVAEINTDIGNNLIRFEIDGHPVTSPPKSIKALKEDWFSNVQFGIPILSPPNRIKQGSFSFQGKSYQLPLNEPDNHLHGEICSKAWDVVDFGSSDEQGAYVTSQFRYAAHPELMQYFPHALTFTITYRLQDGCLHMSGTIANDGEDEAPFAFGLHPYFSIPFETEDEVILSVPAAAEWPVTNLAFVAGEPAVTAFSRDINIGVNIANYPSLGCSLLSMKEGSDHIAVFN